MALALLPADHIHPCFEILANRTHNLVLSADNRRKVDKFKNYVFPPTLTLFLKNQILLRRFNTLFILFVFSRFPFRIGLFGLSFGLSENSSLLTSTSGFEMF